MDLPELPPGVLPRYANPLLNRLDIIHDTRYHADVPANNWFRTRQAILRYRPEPTEYHVISVPDANFPSKVHIEHGTLEPKRLTDWLDSSSAKADKSSCTLRIIFGKTYQPDGINDTSSDYCQIPFDEQQFELVKSSFHVSQQFLWTLEQPTGIVSRFRQISPGVSSYIFKLGVHATGFFTMNVAYSTSRRLTSVLILAQTYAVEFGMMSAMLHWRDYKALFDQPMLLPLIVSTVVSAFHGLKIEESISQLNSLEEDLGQHTYPYRRKEDGLQANFISITTALNANIHRLVINEHRLKSIVSALSKAIQYSSEAVDASLQGSQIDGSRAIVDHIAHLQSYCEHLLSRNEAEQKRTHSLLSVVYNFMAQRENLINQQLAKDTRATSLAAQRDASAMRTIAILTMAFLPGTYVAALFAIPLFQWDAPLDNSVLLPRFWIYWAVSLPLTLLVMIVWALFDRLPDFSNTFTTHSRHRNT